MRRSLLLLLILIGSPAWAQSATVALYAPTATNPNVSVPLSAVVYTPLCNQPKATDLLPPVINPVNGMYDDPASPTTKDCYVSFGTQSNALPIGTGYLAAVKVGTGQYGAFSMAFARQLPHVCDGVAATSDSGITGTKTLTFCNGTTTPITAWALYTNGVRSLVTPVKGTANSVGQFAYTVSVSVPVGVTTFEIAAVNQTQEAAKSPTFTYTAAAPIITPGPSTIRSVQ